MKTRIHVLILLTAVLAIVAAACGGGDTETEAAVSDTTTAATTTSTTTTQAPTTTTTTMATTTTTTSTPTTTTVPLTNLTSLEATVGSGESIVAAGAYASTSLSVPVRFGFAEDVSVSLDQGHYIGVEPPAGREKWVGVWFADFTGLPQPDQVPLHEHSPDSWLPIADDTDWAEFFEANDGLVLLDSGTVRLGDSATAAWWDFSADETAGGGYDCPFGGNCFNVVVVQGEYWIVGEELGVRVWKLEGDEGALHAWFQSPIETFADNVAFGDDILSGVSVGG